MLRIAAILAGVVVCTIATTNALAQTQYEQAAADGTRWRHTDPAYLATWVEAHNREIASGRFDAPPPTGVDVGKFPTVSADWYSGAPSAKPEHAVAAPPKRGWSLAVIGQGAEQVVSRWRADPAYQAVVTEMGSTLHLQVYRSVEEAEAIAPGITHGGAPDIVLGVVEHGSPLDGKVVMRWLADPGPGAIAGQLRDKRRPDYDPAKDPTPFDVPGLNLTSLRAAADAFADSPFLPVLGIVVFILICRRFA